MESPENGIIHEAVEAVRKRDRRIRRGFVGLALFITLLLVLHTWVGFDQRGTLETQVDVLEQQGAELERLAHDARREARASQRLIREMRERFKHQAQVSRRLQRRTARFLERLARRAGIEVEGLNAPARIVTGRGGGGGSPGKASKPPPKPAPKPPGNAPPKVCENPGKACER